MQIPLLQMSAPMAYLGASIIAETRSVYDYHDPRPTSRMFRMSFARDESEMLREDPDSHQRFVATITGDAFMGAGTHPKTREQRGQRTSTSSSNGLLGEELGPRNPSKSTRTCRSKAQKPNLVGNALIVGARRSFEQPGIPEIQARF
jgi:hypothetical protein